MSQIIDSLERSQNHTRGYRHDARIDEISAKFVFIPRYVKYIVPVIQIGIGVVGAVLVGMLVLA